MNATLSRAIMRMASKWLGATKALAHGLVAKCVVRYDASFSSNRNPRETTLGRRSANSVPTSTPFAMLRARIFKPARDRALTCLIESMKGDCNLKISVQGRDSAKLESKPVFLKGWQQITDLLGQPISVTQRWAKNGMPVKRQGRFVTVFSEELNNWLGRESGEPVYVATEDAGLSAELKRGLSYLRGGKHRKRPNT
jgi:hypothetical protein